MNGTQERRVSKGADWAMKFAISLALVVVTWLSVQMHDLFTLLNAHSEKPGHAVIVERVRNLEAIMAEQRTQYREILKEIREMKKDQKD